MPYKKFVEIGRVAYINAGPEAGKIAAIVNVIDQNRVLVDGPTSGVRRQTYAMKQIHLTPIKVSFPFDAPTRIVRKELVANKVPMVQFSSFVSTVPASVVCVPVSEMQEVVQ
jgi:large subunit ribosomal protein L14e